MNEDLLFSIDRDTSLMNLILILASSDYEEDLLSELYLILKNKDLLNLLLYFGGRTVTFPTLEELKKSLTEVEIYYYVNYLGYSYEQVQRHYDNQLTIEEISSTDSKVKSTIDKINLNRGKLYDN